MNWTNWVDLAFDDEEMVDNTMPMMPERPQYPYGTRICLTGRELEKAKLSLPKCGDMIDMRCFGEVTSVSDGEGGQRVEIQITRLRLENEDTESGEDDE